MGKKCFIENQSKISKYFTKISTMLIRVNLRNVIIFIFIFCFNYFNLEAPTITDKIPTNFYEGNLVYILRIP